MSFNLTDQYISASFQQLVQTSGSSSGSYLVDGTGSLIESLTITASFADFASVAETVQGAIESASYAFFAESSDSASYALSASQAGTANIADFATTSDAASTATSASHALISDSAISASHALNSDNAITASYIENAVSASYATSSSQAENANTATTASHALFSEEAENAEHADAVQFPVIAKETLAKGDPVYVSGFNNGENKPEVLKADASDPSKMPVVGLAMVNASNNDHIFIAVGGNFSNVDTSTGLTSPQIGDTLYVASGGGYTNVKPTGTNLIQNIGVIGRVQQNTGQIVVSAIQRSNDLPNIPEGYVWVGDSNSIPTAVTSQSLYTGKDINVSSISASNATFISASIGYIESITGSAKIIGDAFLILNADTPTQRYAGLAVYDSGSAVSPHTASIQFDGVTNDWFYQYTGSDATDYGVVMFGPEYGTKGSPSYPSNNRILKGDGGHHLQDSSIQDDGAEVQFFNPVTFNQSAEFGNGIDITSGQLNGTASYATKSDYANLDNKPAGLVSGSSQIDVTQTQNIWQYVGINTGNQTISGNKTFSGQTAISGTSLHAVDNSTLGSSGTVNIDFNDANVFYCNPTGAVNFTVSNVPYGTSQTVIVLVENTGQTVTFSGIQFPGGSVPTLTSVGVDILTFISINGDVFCIAQQDFS